MFNLYYALNQLLSLYQIILVVWIILGWMQTYNALPHNQFVHTAMSILFKLTDPVLQPIRRVLPAFGGLDFSPLVVFFIIYLLKDLLRVILI